MASLIIGMIAGVLSVISFIPQVIKIFRTKNTRDLSLMTFLIFSISVSLWLIYGILIREMPVIIANSMILILAIVILLMKTKYG